MGFLSDKRGFIHNASSNPTVKQKEMISDDIISFLGELTLILIQLHPLLKQGGAKSF